MERPPHPTPPRLVGRADERRLLRGFVRSLADTGGALLLRGSPGAGSTCLLDLGCALAHGEGLDVVRVSAREATPGSTLQEAVRTAVGVSTVGSSVRAPDILRDSNDLLSILRGAGHGGPVLLVVDDWDRWSSHDRVTAMFAARTLASERGGLLAAAVRGADTAPPSGMVVHELSPLTATESRRVLADAGVELERGVEDQVVAEAAGNPLALLELASGLTPEERRGLAPLPRLLSVSPRLSAAFLPSLRRLSADAEHVLVLAAVAVPGALTAVLGAGEVASSALDELERADVLHVRGDHSITFALPLLRTLVLSRTPPSELDRARRELAAALHADPDSQAWQRAEYVEGPDPVVADLLTSVAHRAASRGDVERTAAALGRAAELSHGSERRGALLMETARLRATVLGDLEAAHESVAQALAAMPRSVPSLSGTATTAQLAMAAGSPLPPIRDLLIEAVSAAEPADDGGPALHAVFLLLFYVCLLTADPEDWAALEHHEHRFAQDRSPAVRLLRHLLPDLAHVSDAALRDVDAQLRAVDELTDPGKVIALAIAAHHVDRLAECRAALGRIADGARRGHAVSVGAEAMLRLSLDDIATGQLDRAGRSAEEGLQIAREVGRSEHLWAFQLPLATIAAIRGDRSKVDDFVTEMRDWASPRGAHLVEHHCDHVRCLLALGQGDFETAYEAAASVSPPGTLSPHSPVAVATSLELVEAACRTGRREEALKHATAMTDARLSRLSPRQSLREATARAMTSPGSDAAQWYEVALSVSQLERWPLDRGRVELAYGEWLRRQLHSLDSARHHLASAYETFRLLGAHTWADRAAAELRAAGLPLPPDGRLLGAQLVGRDLEIAQLAAAGLSNRQIGERLYLSPRTIGSRLYRIYPRLGVASRAGLQAALSADEAHGG